MYTHIYIYIYLYIYIYYQSGHICVSVLRERVFPPASLSRLFVSERQLSTTSPSTHPSPPPPLTSRSVCPQDLHIFSASLSSDAHLLLSLTSLLLSTTILLYVQYPPLPTAYVSISTSLTHLHLTRTLSVSVSKPIRYIHNHNT